MANPAPAELIEAARAGEPAQIDRLLAMVWPEAYRLSRAILGESPGAEDAAQEACIILYRTITGLRSAAAFRVWFYRIVVREASNLKRRRSSNDPRPEAAPPNLDQTAAIDVWRSLSALPQHLREVVVLRYFEDFSSREIASILQIPAGTVRFRLMIARQRLRPLLDDNPAHFIPASSEVTANAI